MPHGPVSQAGVDLPVVGCLEAAERAFGHCVGRWVEREVVAAPGRNMAAALQLA